MDYKKLSKIKSLLIETEGNVEHIFFYIKELLSIDSLDELLDKMVNDIPKLVNGIDCSIYLLPEFVDKFTGRLLSPDNEIQDASKIETDFVVLAATSLKRNQKNVGNSFYKKGEGLTGWIFKKGRFLSLEDMQDKAELARIDDEIHWMDKYESSKVQFEQDKKMPFMGVPLKGPEGEVFGVIKIPAMQNDLEFPSFLAGLLLSFASLLSSVIEKTKLLADKDTQLEDLLEIGAITEKKELLQTITKSAMKLVDGKQCALFLSDDETHPERYYLRASEGQPNFLSSDVNKLYYNEGEGATGWIAKHNRTLNIKNLTDENELKRIARDLEWEDKGDEFKRDPEKPKAFLGVSLFSERDNKVIGIIRIPAHRFKKAFNKKDEERLEIFAKYVALVLIKTELLLQGKHIDKLIELGRALDLPELLQLVVDEADTIIRGSGCSIFLKDVRTERYYLKATSDSSNDLFKEHVGKLFYLSGQGKTGEVIQTGEPLLLNKIEEKKRSQHDVICETGDDDAQKFLAVPIKAQEKNVIGVIRIPRTDAHLDFTVWDLELLESLVNQVALVIRNAELFKEREHRAQALETISKLNEHLQKIEPDLPLPQIIEKFFFLTLTCLTRKDGLGFNRAIILKYDHNKDTISGALGIGTMTVKEAEKVWNKLEKGEYSFDIAVETYNKKGFHNSTFNDEVKKLCYTNISTDKNSRIPISPILSNETIVIKNMKSVSNSESVNLDEQFSKLIETETFAMVPFVGHHMVLGAIYFDKKHNAQPINEEDIHLVEIVANQVAIAIENAQLMVELKNRMKMERDQLDELAHALKQPIQPLVFAVDDLRENKFKNAYQREENKKILTRGIYNLRLFSHNILYTSQIDIGTFKSEDRKITDIRELVNQVYDLYKIQAEHNNTTISRPEFTLRQNKIEIDYTKLEIALHNLVINAINYSVKGGGVTFKTLEEKGMIKFIIKNRGKIITKSNPEKIFNRYEKGSTSKGVGLGLYITRKIAKSFQGDVIVQSNNDYTIFTLYFPI